MKRFFYILIMIAGCKEEYNPPLKNAEYSYLVVEGNIVAGNDSTFIHLTRTVAVSDTSVIDPETTATVNVESEDGETYQLQNEHNGIYDSPPLNISPDKNYRLHIFTADGKEFASEYVAVKQTPPIDSVSWKSDASGVTIYANAHDATNSTLYYRWDYTETWEHRARYDSYYIYENGVLRVRQLDEHVYHCWSVVPSSSVSIASTAELSSDIVFEKPLVQIPAGSEKLSIVYSILVKQYALTKDAFEFWQNLKKNTEQIGTIFDPQPFSNFGNMHCITDPSEPVVGFISACSESQQRIYIYNSDVQMWPYSLPVCETDTLKSTDNISYILTGGGLLPVYFINLDLLVAGAECVDCRFHGGGTIKPPYMP